jgi:hypothetical protein
MHPDPIWIPILALLLVPALAIGLPLARAHIRRIEREPAPSAPPHEITLRLERMEQAIDSIAVEVERISEGQRFTTKLLAERGTIPSSTPSSQAPRA